MNSPTETHCCNISPIMNYDTAWIIGPLGQIAVLPQPNHSRVFNQAEITLFSQSWTNWFGAGPTMIAVFIYA